MADDLFTRELEWMMRMRRERHDLHRLALRLRRFLEEVASTQCERDIRRWATPEAERMHDHLDRLCDLLGTSDGRYLDGNVVTDHSLGVRKLGG